MFKQARRENCHKYVILCSKSWLNIEVTPRQKIAYFLQKVDENVHSPAVLLTWGALGLFKVPLAIALACQCWLASHDVSIPTPKPNSPSPLVLLLISVRYVVDGRAVEFWKLCSTAYWLQMRYSWLQSKIIPNHRTYISLLLIGAPFYISTSILTSTHPCIHPSCLQYFLFLPSFLVPSPLPFFCIDFLSHGIHYFLVSLSFLFFLSFSFSSFPAFAIAYRYLPASDFLSIVLFSFILLLL